MIRSLSALFYRIASWKTLLLAVLLYVPIPLLILGPLEKQLNTYAGYEIGPIDLLIGEVNPAKIQQMVADYGPEGRAVYAQGALIDDTIYPIVYTFFFCIILSLLHRRRATGSGPLFNIFPLVVLVLDLVENALIITLLNGYPTPLPTLAVGCVIATNMKWASFGVTLVLAIYGLVRLMMRKPLAEKLSV
ncbi:hypothetical protein GCM10027347_33880 [Larkinella harenae]